MNIINFIYLLCINIFILNFLRTKKNVDAFFFNERFRAVAMITVRYNKYFKIS